MPVQTLLHSIDSRTVQESPYPINYQYDFLKESCALFHTSREQVTLSGQLVALGALTVRTKVLDSRADGQYDEDDQRGNAMQCRKP